MPAALVSSQVRKSCLLPATRLGVSMASEWVLLVSAVPKSREIHSRRSGAQALSFYDSR